MAQLPADLLAYATKFTFDGNRVEPGDRRWHPDLVISVERARPGEWRIVQTGMAYDHRNDTWEIEYAARVAQGADRSAFHTGRDDAVRRALTLIERIRIDLAPTSCWFSAAICESRATPGP